VVANVALEEYRAEIRAQVCSRCVERPAGGPPCAPLGKFCGVETHLPELIESIHQVQSGQLEPYLEHNRQAICEQCVFRQSSICPCPMDYLACLVVQAVETVDERHRGQADEDTGRPTAPPPARGPEQIERLYEQVAGTWTGCDWPTTFGKSRLDLHGTSAAEASQVPVVFGTQAEVDWRQAAVWLARVERFAAEAEREGAAAMTAARAGDWEEAAHHAERAAALEFATGRPLWRRLLGTWQSFSRAFEDAPAERGAVGAATC
jgi:hypothetical protein